VEHRDVSHPSAFWSSRRPAPEPPTSTAFGDRDWAVMTLCHMTHSASIWARPRWLRTQSCHHEASPDGRPRAGDCGPMYPIRRGGLLPDVLHRAADKTLADPEQPFGIVIAIGHGEADHQFVQRCAIRPCLSTRRDNRSRRCNFLVLRAIRLDSFFAMLGLVVAVGCLDNASHTVGVRRGYQSQSARQGRSPSPSAAYRFTVTLAVAQAPSSQPERVPQVQDRTTFGSRSSTRPPQPCFARSTDRVNQAARSRARRALRLALHHAKTLAAIGPYLLTICNPREFASCRGVGGKGVYAATTRKGWLNPRSCSCKWMVDSQSFPPEKKKGEVTCASTCRHLHVGTRA